MSGRSTPSSTASRTPCRIRRYGGGQGHDRWVLLDFGDIVVHVQHSEERSFYDLERLWKDCPRIGCRCLVASSARHLAAWRTPWNLEHRFQGQTDVALDAVGVRQARPPRVSSWRCVRSRS